MAATGFELCKGHFIAKAVLPFLDLARQVRNKVTPDLGQVAGKGLFGVTLDMDGCYWFGALPAPLQCKSSSAFPQWPLQSSKPVALSRGLASIRGYFVPHLSGKVEEWQNCCCNEVALAELQPRTSLFPWLGLNPRLLCSSLVGQGRGMAELLLQ